MDIFTYLIFLVLRYCSASRARFKGFCLTMGLLFYLTKYFFILLSVLTIFGYPCNVPQLGLLSDIYCWYPLFILQKQVRDVAAMSYDLYRYVIFLE